MTILALTRLHYGADYLDAVIRSSEPFAEKHVVVYTDKPNFPGEPSIPCPDTREQLYEIARIAGGERLHWIDDPHPGVSVAFQHYRDIEMLLELDADEVIHQDLCADILRSHADEKLTAKRYRLPFIHHWRTFRYGCTDGQWPVRLYVPNAEQDEIAWYPRTGTYIHHFGYVRRAVDMQYKWDLSLHKSELRPEWWTDIWAAFPERLQDLHPVSNNGFWNAEPFEDGLLPAALVNHQYRYLEVVE